jgi:hypothetical protein
MSGFSRSFTVTTTPSTYPNFLNKGKTTFECKCQISSATFRFFVDASENLVMADDVATPSNPPIAPIEKEKLEDALHDEAPLDKTPLDKAPLDINVNGRAKKNCPEKWCALESIVWLGIADCLLTHMP